MLIRLILPYVHNFLNNKKLYMQKENYTIVVIEDDKKVNSSIVELLSEKYEKIVSYYSSKEAFDNLHKVAPDLVLLDIFLGPNNGLDLLDDLRKLGYNMPVIIITAFTDIKMAIRAMKLGAEDFIVKPVDLEQLEVSVSKTLRNYNLRRKVGILSEQLKAEQPGEILGDSPLLKNALEMAKIFAAADDTTVLLLGESGTGKELFARYIHENSPRSKGPFITINCGAIPKDLAENELFGYEKGAFTGAIDKIKPGRFEQAHKGTILFDEVGELTLDLQVKLLRVLQEKKYYRLGGQKEIKVDVRVITSTNRDLDQLVEEGKFREDLFYRLNVARIELPPLRDRGNDIMILATSLVDKFNKKFGKKLPGFTSEAADILTTYNWRGNIRELANIIERVVLLENENIIGRESLNFLKQSTTAKENPAKIILDEGEHFLKISKNGAPLENVLKDLIEETLIITNGNQNKAAKLLSISRAKLRYRIEQLGVQIPGKDDN